MRSPDFEPCWNQSGVFVFLISFTLFYIFFFFQKLLYWPNKPHEREKRKPILFSNLIETQTFIFPFQFSFLLQNSNRRANGGFVRQGIELILFLLWASTYATLLLFSFIVWKLGKPRVRKGMASAVRPVLEQCSWEWEFRVRDRTLELEARDSEFATEGVVVVKPRQVWELILFCVCDWILATWFLRVPFNYVCWYAIVSVTGIYWKYKWCFIELISVCYITCELESE